MARSEAGNNVVYVHAGQQVIADYARGAAAAAPSFRYVYGSYVDEPLLRHAGTGTTLPTSGTAALYYHRNQQYSIVALSDAAGTLVERYAYTAYGELTILAPDRTLRPTSSFENRYTYTAREWDPTLRLYYFRARWLEPKAGRFIGRDPLGYVDGMGLYGAYFVPNKVDPYGEQKITAVCGEAPELKWVPEHDGLARHGHFEKEYRQIVEFDYFTGKGKSPCPKGWELIGFKNVPENLHEVVENISQNLSCYKRCQRCTATKLKAFLEAIQREANATEMIPWPMSDDDWSINKCGRWAQGFLNRDRSKWYDSDCVFEATLAHAATWFPGLRHAVVRIVMCDGSVIYLDNTGSMGSDHIGVPTDIWLGPIVWRFDTKNYTENAIPENCNCK